MAKEVLDTIMSIQPKDSGGGSGETRESVVHRMAGEMLEKLPPDYVPHEVRAERNHWSVASQRTRRSLALGIIVV